MISRVRALQKIYVVTVDVATKSTRVATVIFESKILKKIFCVYGIQTNIVNQNKRLNDTFFLIFSCF
jgi:hypothetical protein